MIHKGWPAGRFLFAALWMAVLGGSAGLPSVRADSASDVARDARLYAPCAAPDFSAATPLTATTNDQSSGHATRRCSATGANPN